MTPAATKYPLGLGPFAILLVLLMLVSASAYFAISAGDATELVVLGHVIAGPGTSLRLMAALAVLFGVAALYLLVRSARNFGNEQYVMLDANLIEISGLDLDGGKRIVTHSEIVTVMDYKVQGVASVEIRLRDGTSLNLAEAQFRTRAQYRQFRADLESRLPSLLNRLALAAMLLLSVGTAPALASDSGKDVTLGAVTAQLYYERSGTLSEDLIARDPPFTGWNTVIGEGDAREPSEYLLVSAVLANPGDEAFLDEKLTIRVTGETGKKIKERGFSGMLIAHRGSLRLPLWIDDAGCLGPITITATFRKQKISAPLQLMCGE